MTWEKLILPHNVKNGTNTAEKKCVLYKNRTTYILGIFFP